MHSGHFLQVLYPGSAELREQVGARDDQWVQEGDLTGRCKHRTVARRETFGQRGEVRHENFNRLGHFARRRAFRHGRDGAVYLDRHSPDAIQNRGIRTTVPPPRERYRFRSHPMGWFWRLALVRKAIWPDFLPFRQTPPVVFTGPSIFPAYAGTDLRRRSSIRLRIFRNSSLGTATSASWM